MYDKAVSNLGSRVGDVGTAARRLPVESDLKAGTSATLSDTHGQDHKEQTDQTKQVDRVASGGSIGPQKGFSVFVFLV